MRRKFCLSDRHNYNNSVTVAQEKRTPKVFVFACYSECMHNFLYRFALVVLVLSAVVFFCVLFAQMYVRWYVNQNFAFIGGFGLESLAALVLGLTLGLLYLPRSRA